MRDKGIVMDIMWKFQTTQWLQLNAMFVICLPKEKIFKHCFGIKTHK